MFVRVLLRVLVIVLLNKTSIAEYITPTISLTSCMYNTASLQIHNATAGGLVYIRTDSVYNMIPTYDGEIFYECQFDTCNIMWDEQFWVVVQRKVLYQTKYDVIVWFLCTTDFESIMPVAIDFGDIDETNRTTKNYRPAVVMSFKSAGAELASGSVVKLGTPLNMELVVVNNIDNLMDISVKACWASAMSLISDKCPIDADLFGAFERTAIGNLSNTFYMFRPTSTIGGAYDVTFTCLLEVCLYACEMVTCTNISNTTAAPSVERRKRDVTSNEEESSRPYMLLGSMLRAIAEGEDVKEDVIKPTDNICIDLEIAIICIALWSILITTLTVAACVSFHRRSLYQRAELVIKSLKDGNMLAKPQLACVPPNAVASSASRTTPNSEVPLTVAASSDIQPKEKAKEQHIKTLSLNSSNDKVNGVHRRQSVTGCIASVHAK